MAQYRLRIKLSNFEIEYEGEDSFDKDGVLALLKDVMAIVPQINSSAGSNSDLTAAERGGWSRGAVTIATIAAHLDPDGTQDVAMCALAKLQIVDGKQQVSKADIWEEMKGATGYFKSAMSRNFPRDLGRMVKGKKINEVGSGIYSLTAGSAKELEAKLANIE